MRVRDVPINDIQVGDRFRKELGDLSELIDSIKSKGLIQPITLDEGLNLMAGGRRLAASREADLKKVPCIIRQSDGPIDSLEIELFENLHRKSLEWWEEVALKKKIHELKVGSDPEWHKTDTARVLGEGKSNTQRDLDLADAVQVMPELMQQKSKGDAQKILTKMYRQAEVHHLRKTARFSGAAKHAADHYKVGDAWDGIQKINTGTVGFIEMDPPYAIDLKTSKRGREKSTTIGKYKEEDPKMYPLFLEMFAIECYRIMRDHSYIVWWFGMTHYGSTIGAMKKAGFRVPDIPAIWYKGKTGQVNNPDRDLASSYETFMVGQKGKPKLIKPARSNVFDFPPVPAQRKVHATEKPIELMTEIMETFVLPDSIICSPFLGSGVTLRAAYRYGIVGYGWDLSDDTKSNFLLTIEEDVRAGLIKERE
jgi:ParB/RepB/Spo0J family partition protein